MGNWQFEFDERDRSWVEHAACRGMGADLFFPEKGVHANETGAAAKRVCAGCSVQAECLEYGLSESFGIWGANSTKERRVVRRNLKGAA